MLDKDPKKRITIKDIKKHPFFKEIDWNLLSQRKINPPVKLSLSNQEIQEQLGECEDEEEQLFL